MCVLGPTWEKGTTGSSGWAGSRAGAHASPGPAPCERGASCPSPGLSFRQLGYMPLHRGGLHGLGLTPNSGQPQEMSLGPWDRWSVNNPTFSIYCNLSSEHAQGIQAKEPRLGMGARGEQGSLLGTKSQPLLPPTAPPTNTSFFAPTHDPNSISTEFI